jgi:hypothetical protein
VSLIDFSPSSGQAFDILDWGSLTGAFSSIDLPSLPGLVWDTSQLYTTGVLSVAASGLAGDYNQDGTVDATDYVVWRKGLGTTYMPSDFNVWRANFGAMAGSGSVAGANIAVPEPATLVLLMFAVAGWCLGQRRVS